MKSRLHKIEIRNFKAFREFTLNLEGRHLLVYGENGAGKSSLYWALYTFLQSARKPKNSIAKYFDPDGPENLLNIHEQANATPKPGEIALTLRETATKNDTTYRISQTDHGTHQQPAILKGDLATAGTGQWTEGDAFSGVQSAFYWSSSSLVADPDFAWFVNLYDGDVGAPGKTFTLYVWPVRGGQ